MPKTTRLSEDAEIYQPRKKLSERQKLKEMTTLPKKISYLWEYYRTAAFIVIAVSALVIYIIHMILTPKIETSFYAAVINNPIHPDILDQLKEDFSEHLQIDPMKEKIELNYSFYFNGAPDYSMNMNQVFSTYVASGEIDILIAPKSEFTNYTQFGFLAKLTDQLPTDVYSALTNQFYIADTDEDPEKSVYGIYLKDTELFKNYTDDSDPYMLGILLNSKHNENNIEFIRYLFQLN